MLTSAIGYIMVNLLLLILNIVGTIFVAFQLPTVSIASYTGYVFGNIMLLNAFLPVTEFLVLGGFALTLKAAIVVFKGFIMLMSFSNFVRKTFLQISV